MAEFKPGDKVRMVPPNGMTLRQHPDYDHSFKEALAGVLTVRHVFVSRGRDALTFEECSPKYGATGEGPDRYWRFYISPGESVWFKKQAISSKEDMEALYD